MVCEMIWCPSVPTVRLLQQLVADLLFWAWQVGDNDQLLHGQCRSSTGPQHSRAVSIEANACSATISAYLGS